MRRTKVMTAQLGLTERILTSAKDRAMMRTIDDGLERVEAGLAREVVFADSIADVTGRYLLDAGGKRIRPLLTLLIAQLGTGTSDDVVTAAEAIEITHLASLYHDDVMDDADQRRGVPSVQSVWGNSVAILTGDLLFARASQLMAGLGERAIRLQVATFERLVLGQLHETVGPQPGDDPIEHYFGVLADKTGSLIAAAAHAGIVFSGAPAEFEEPVLAFGEKIGVAFQLIDDVIDLAPPPDHTGKVPGVDLRAGVPTLPLLRLRELASSDRAACALVDRLDQEISASDSTDTFSAHFLDAIAELRKHQVTVRTREDAGRWARDAVTALDPLPAGPVKQALTKFATVVVERTR